MVILTYTGILLFNYGIYNIFCYYYMLPTSRSAHIMRTQQKNGRYENPIMLGLAEIIVKKCSLEWNSSEAMTRILEYNKIYYPATVYCVSLILTMLCGLFLFLPLLFWNKSWFIVMSVGVLLYVSTGILQLMYRYRKAEESAERSPTKSVKIIQHKWQRLLPGAFLLCQIIVFITLLT